MNLRTIPQPRDLAHLTRLEIDGLLVDAGLDIPRMRPGHNRTLILVPERTGIIPGKVEVHRLAPAIAPERVRGLDQEVVPTREVGLRLIVVDQCRQDPEGAVVVPERGCPDAGGGFVRQTGMDEYIGLSVCWDASPLTLD